MSDQRQEPLDLDAVREPASPPPEASDKRTAQGRSAEREDSEIPECTELAGRKRTRRDLPLDSGDHSAVVSKVRGGALWRNVRRVEPHVVPLATW